jgi:hypothetical protein
METSGLGTSSAHFIGSARRSRGHPEGPSRTRRRTRSRSWSSARRPAASGFESPAANPSRCRRGLRCGCWPGRSCDRRGSGSRGRPGRRPRSLLTLAADCARPAMPWEACGRAYPTGYRRASPPPDHDRADRSESDARRDRSVWSAAGPAARGFSRIAGAGPAASCKDAEGGEVREYRPMDGCATGFGAGQAGMTAGSARPRPAASRVVRPARPARQGWCGIGAASRGRSRCRRGPAPRRSSTRHPASPPREPWRRRDRRRIR